eukprot:gene19801-21741_t
MDAPKKRFVYKPVNSTRTASNSKPSTSNFQFQKAKPSTTANLSKEQRKPEVVVASFKNQKRSLQDLNEERAMLESPAKKLKRPPHTDSKTKNETGCKEVGELDFALDNFDDFEDDDFSKGLTANDLTILEIEASQKVKSDTSRKNSKNENFSALHQFDRLLSDKTSCSVERNQEISIDLFPTAKTPQSVSAVSQVEAGKFDTIKLKHLKNQLTEYTAKVKMMEEQTFSKEGEIKMLRQNLDKIQEERDFYKLKVLKAEENLKAKQNESELKLQREIEKLTTQLQFKEKEVQEVRETRLKSEKGRDSEKRSVGNSGTPQNAKKASQRESTASSSSPFDDAHNFFLKQKPGTKTSSIKRKEIEDEVEKSREKQLLKIKVASQSYVAPDAAFKQELTLERYGSARKEFLIELNKIFQNLHFDCGLPEDDDSDKESIKENFQLSVEELIFLCNWTVQVQHKSSIFSILELIEVHIIEYLASVKKQEPHVSLLCEEKEPFLSEPAKIEAKKKKRMQILSDDEVGKVSLLILTILTAHSVDVQENFLLSLFEDETDEIFTQQMTKPDGNIDADLNPILKELSSKIFFKSDSKTDPASYENDCLKITQNIRHLNNLKYDSKMLVNSIFDFYSSEKNEEIIKGQIFDIIVSLSSSSSPVSKAGLLNTLCNCPAFNCISQNFRRPSLMSLLCIIKHLSLYPRIENILCQRQGVCTLQNIYKALVQMPNECITKDDWNDVRLEITQTVSTLFVSGSTSMRFLLESECNCSSELVRCLIIMLLEESREFRECCLEYIEDNTLNDCKTFSILRQGMSLLSHICLNDRYFLDHRADVEWQYISLINTTIHLYRRIPSIREFEVQAIQDLLDLEDLVDTEDDPLMEDS